MNYKKTILYLLISVFVLIFVYNFGLPFIASQYNSEMGMHMTYNYYNNSYYFYSNIISLLIFTLTLLIAIITLIKLFSFSGTKKCRKCGMAIESDDWKICPRCGNPLDDGRVK